MNPWKTATAGIALVVVTAVATGLGTAYLTRPAIQTETEAGATLASAPAVRETRMASLRPAVARTAQPLVRRPAADMVVSEPMASPASRPVSVAQPAVTAPVRPVAASAAADCATGGERAMRIAKPGLLGAVLGAGMGAAGGAIANGGKAAGKGAVIGGLAGAAVGSAYGAYKTKQDCGTIFGGGTGFSGGTPAPASPDRDITYTSAARPSATEASLNARNSGDGGTIQIYNAR